MTSVSIAKSGSATVEFRFRGSKRKLYAGKIRRREAQQIARQIDSLLVSARNGLALSPESTEWIQQVDDRISSRLLQWQLVDANDVKEVGLTLADVAARFQKKCEITRAGRVAQPRTQHNLRGAIRNLFGFFGKDKLCSRVTTEDGDRFYVWLGTSGRVGERESYRGWRPGLAASSVAARYQLCRSLFDFAATVDAGMKLNPLRLYQRPRANRTNICYVDAEDLEDIMGEFRLRKRGNWLAMWRSWRIAVFLSRYGGLTNPSETALLRWSDIVDDPQLGPIMRVQKPKTHRERTCPVFSRLKPILAEARGYQSDDGFVIPNPAVRGSFYSNEFLQRQVRASGHPVWPRIWQNLRASCVVDLVDSGYPTPIIAEWMGHSERVMREHYIKGTSHHFLQASGGGNFQGK